jgi:hypothetical protein
MYICIYVYIYIYIYMLQLENCTRSKHYIAYLPNKMVVPRAQEHLFLQNLFCFTQTHTHTHTHTFSAWFVSALCSRRSLATSTCPFQLAEVSGLVPVCEHASKGKMQAMLADAFSSSNTIQVSGTHSCMTPNKRISSETNAPCACTRQDMLIYKLLHAYLVLALYSNAVHCDISMCMHPDTQTHVCEC